MEIDRKPLLEMMKYADKFLEKNRPGLRLFISNKRRLCTTDGRVAFGIQLTDETDVPEVNKCYPIPTSILNINKKKSTVDIQSVKGGIKIDGDYFIPELKDHTPPNVDMVIDPVKDNGKPCEKYVIFDLDRMYQINKFLPGFYKAEPLMTSDRSPAYWYYSNLFIIMMPIRVR